MQETITDSTNTESRVRRMMRSSRTLAWRSFKIFMVAVVVYAAVILIGLLPVNGQFEPAGDDGIEIFVVSNEVHAELILPLNGAVGDDLKAFFAPTDFHALVSSANWLAVGWGDKSFFVETRSWEDARAMTMVRALCLPTKTALHATAIQERGDIWSDARPVRISAEQFQRITAYVRDAFELKQEQPQQIENAAYDDNDAFFHAKGLYHAFNTCNCWVGGGLRDGGVKVGWYTPLPKTVFLHLPNHDEPPQN